MSGAPREPDYRVEDWTWEARRVRSSVRQGQTGASEAQVLHYKRELTRRKAGHAAYPHSVD